MVLIVSFHVMKKIKINENDKKQERKGLDRLDTIDNKYMIYIIIYNFQHIHKMSIGLNP